MHKATKKECGRHRKLLQDPDVKRWYDNIARGSTITADVRLRRLGVYCENTNTIPRVCRDWNQKRTRCRESFDGLLSFLEKSGYCIILKLLHPLADRLRSRYMMSKKNKGRTNCGITQL